MKNKKGFTLIELLVVIALMLSILGIAVVSLINISNKKKKESWEQVKGQIETAAVEYFTANEYLFEGLQNGSIGTISVGKLVSEDYLNKVTNPDTGKAVSMCALVNITKDGEKYNATFDNTSTESQVAQCESNNIITVSEPGAPEFDIKDTCKNKSGSDIAKQNEYCYSETFSVDNSKEKYKPHGKITSKKYCVGTGTSCNTDTEFTDSFDGAAETEENGVVGITLINQSGAKTTKYKDYKIDRTAPTGTVTLSRSSGVSYNSNTPKLTINTNDNESGLSTASFNNAKNPTSGKNSWNISGRNWNPTVNNFVIYKGPGLKNQYKNGSGDTIGEGTVNLTVTDKVGNVGILRNNKYVLYSKCSKITKTVSEGEYGSCSAACGGGTKTRTDTTNVKDKYISGVSCPGDGATNKVTANCNTQGCCSKTKETGRVSWGSWSSKCNSSDEQTREGTKNLVSAYDDSVSCGTTTKYDSKTCDLTPEIDKVQFRYNKSKCPKGWVEIRYSGINMAKYTASFTYSHTVQGTTATASTLTDDSNSLTETFCRGYGSSKKNVMSFQVTFKNKSNKKTRKYSGKCKYSEMFNSGNSYNSSWHDCDMN